MSRFPVMSRVCRLAFASAAIIAAQLVFTSQIHAVDLIVNGRFETGDLTGWNKTGNWMVGTQTPSAYTSGTTFDNTFSLYQEVHIPAETRSATLAWSHSLYFSGAPINPAWMRVEVQPAGGGTALATLLLVVNDPPYTNPGFRRYQFDLAAELPEIRGQTVRLNWKLYAATTFTGPVAGLTIADVSLLVDPLCDPPATIDAGSPSDGATDIPSVGNLSWEDLNVNNLVVPRGTDLAEGDSGISFPFNLSSGYGVHIQQFYAASEFDRGGRIRQLRFRRDGASVPFNRTVQCEVRMGYSTVSPNYPDIDFADNYVSSSLVYSGPLTVSSTSTATPREFDIIINLEEPFDYDPAVGPLTIGLWWPNMSGPTISNAPYLDQQSSPGLGYMVSTPAIGDTEPFPYATSRYRDRGFVTQFVFDESIPPTGPCAVIYDVYFGASNPPSELIGENLPFASIGKPTLGLSTPYYWQVIGKRLGALSETAGPVWTFTSAPASLRFKGDFDLSGCTDVSDFLFLLDNWQTDLEGTIVGTQDFLHLLDQWKLGPECG